MQENKNEAGEKIVRKVIEDEMKQSYLDYSMSVIVGRALPDVRDGLKPVHRRILYAMHQMGMLHNKPFKKSARIVGEVLGKFHPHGDVAVYDALVRMVQPFSLRYPLIKGQGNFGSIDGDAPAAMRYTEAKLAKIAEEMLQDIDKKTVKFVPNFDGTLEEPTFLPSKLPNLLINGSSGIAVGMATNIPPHNIVEIVDGIIAVIDNPDITIPEIMQFVKGPDFPTAGIILGKQGVRTAYETGKGRVIVRARTAVEQGKIIIYEIPYMVNKSILLEEIADLVREKKIGGIEDIRDESDREGIRIVIELEKEANANVVLNQLFKHTKLQTTFGIIMLALVDNKPVVLNLKQLIEHYIRHRQIVVRKRCEFDFDVAQKKAHILEGLIIALQNLDETIVLIKKSKSVEEARSSLIAKFGLSVEQAQAILDMKLQRLTSLEQEKIRNEHSDTLKLISELTAILGSEQRILDLIKMELLEIRKEYGDERRTEIVEQERILFEAEDLIKAEDMVVTMSHTGYIKRQPVDTYRAQKRGGRGVLAAGTKEEDFVEELFIANTHSYILFFTNKGKVHWLKVHEIPECGRQAKGKAIANLLKLSEGERITAFVPVRSFDGYLIMVTGKGIVKRISLDYFSNPRRGGIAAITLDEGDELIEVKKTSGNEQLMIATRNGMAVKFNEEDVRPVGRTGRGVRGIRLKNGDEVIGMVLAPENGTLLSVTEKGFGKRSPVSAYRLIRRGGSGVRNMKCTEKNGKVVAIKSVLDDDELMLMSQKGIAIRVKAKDVSVIGRVTQGVRLMRLEEGDQVIAAAKVVEE